MQAYWLDCIHLLVFRRTIWQYLLKLKSHSVWHSKLFTPKMYPVDTLMEVFICTYILKRISCLYAGSLQSCPTLCDLWTVAQAPLSLGLSRQEYRSALPCPPPGGSSRPGDRTCISCGPYIADEFSITEPPGKPQQNLWLYSKEYSLKKKTMCITSICVFKVCFRVPQWLCHRCLGKLCKSVHGNVSSYFLNIDASLNMINPHFSV